MDSRQAFLVGAGAVAVAAGTAFFTKPWASFWSKMRTQFYEKQAVIKYYGVVHSADGQPCFDNTQRRDEFVEVQLKNGLVVRLTLHGSSASHLWSRESLVDNGVERVRTWIPVGLTVFVTDPDHTITRAHREFFDDKIKNAVVVAPSACEVHTEESWRRRAKVLERWRSLCSSPMISFCALASSVVVVCGIGYVWMRNFGSPSILPRVSILDWDVATNFQAPSTGALVDS